MIATESPRFDFGASWQGAGHQGGRPISNPGPDMVNGKPAMNHHRDDGSDNDFNDPASWNKASYTPDYIADIGEPLPEPVNGYREAAKFHLGLMFAIDEYVTAAEDTRLAIVAVAVVFGWPSARGLSIANIADQLGCTPAALTRSIARFKTMAGLDSAGGARPGAGLLNGDKPATVRA